jgi:glycosyltransferase involved in cell wall biosynthesis
MFSLADIQSPYGSTARPSLLGKHLALKGVDLLHVCEELPGSPEGVEVVSRRDLASRTNTEEFHWLRERCRRFAPDLIYSHQVHTAGTGLRISRALKRPHIFDAHSSLAHELRTFGGLPLKEKICRIASESVAMKFSDLVIVPSSELKDYIVRKYLLSPGRIRIVKNGVETDAFKPAPPDPSLRENLGIPRDAVLVLFTNPRLATFPSNEMALRMLFRAIPNVERLVPSVRFLILGGGPELKGPSSNVIYSGYVNDLPSYLNLADICIAPYPPEAVCGGTRDKVCEYLACGKPIVATREAMRGFDDALPGEHYLLAADEHNLAEKILDCVRRPEEAGRIGRNARALSERYDWSRQAGKLLGLFEEAGQAWNARHLS